jgi:WD40 repeat protein
VTPTFTKSTGESWRRFEAIYDRFEQEWDTHGDARIEDYLPPEGSPDRAAVLPELVKIDIERRWSVGQQTHIEDYVRTFPELAPDGVVPINLINHEAEVRRGHERRQAAGVADNQPSQLGKYELHERLGHGGFASVYRAWDPGLSRDVAVKVPRDDLLTDPGVRARIMREARSAAQLRHPGIVPLHEVGQDGSRMWLVYEFVAGPTLAAVLRETHPAPRQAAVWASALAEALDYAHRSGIVHRDLKPANVVMRGGTEPVLTDFGLALHTENATTLTAHGDVLGTPAYMSPEQASGRSHQVDGRSDIYSLGVMLYEMLAGQVPFHASPPVVIHKVLHEEPTPLRTLRTDIPVDLETICLKAMAKDPAHRYATAGEFADDLNRYLNHQPIRARRIGPLGQLRRWVRRNPALAGTLSVAIALIVGVAGFSYWRVSDERDHYRIERDRAQALAADLALDRGLSLCDQGEIGPGLLWMARALELNPADSPDNDRVIRLNFAAWAGRLPECVQALPHNDVIDALAFTPDGKTLLTAGMDSQVHQWDWQAGVECTAPLRNPRPVKSIVMGPKGDSIIAGMESEGINVWSRENDQAEPRSFPDFPECQGLAHHPTQPLVLVADRRDRTRMLDIGTGDPVGPEFVHGARIWGVAFSSDGKLVLTGGDDRHAKIWNATTGELIASLEHAMVVQEVAFSPDGERIATATSGNHVRIWSLRNHQLLHMLRHGGQSESLAFSPDGRFLLTGSRDRLARLWDARTGTLACPPIQHAGHVLAVAFAPDGHTFATASDDRMVRGWRVPAAGATSHRLEHPATVWSAAYSPDGSVILAGYGERGRSGGVQLWDSALRLKSGPAISDSDAVTCTAFAPDGATYLTGSYSGVIRLRDAKTGQQVGQPIIDAGAASALGITPSGQQLAIARMGRGDRELVFYDRVTRRPGARLGHRDSVRGLAFDRDGTIALTGSFDSTAQLWDLRTGSPIGPPLQHTGQVGAAALSADGCRLVTGSDDQKAYLWERDCDKVTPHFRLSHRGTVRAVALQPGGGLVLTGSWDRTARLWDFATGRPIGPPLNHDGEVETAAFRPDGRSCLTGGWDKSIRIWQVPVATDGSVGQLKRWAEVLAGQELGNGDSPRILESADWLVRWRESRR